MNGHRRTWARRVYFEWEAVFGFSTSGGAVSEAGRPLLEAVGNSIDKRQFRALLARASEQSTANRVAHTLTCGLDGPITVGRLDSMQAWEASPSLGECGGAPFHLICEAGRRRES
jgi:hypothetical protein